MQTFTPLVVTWYTSDSLRLQKDQSPQFYLDFVTTRGTFAWLSALPLSEYDFTLHKAAFHDVTALRYG